MADLYEPTKEEIKHCLDFLSKTLVVTICMGDTEKKELSLREQVCCSPKIN